MKHSEKSYCFKAFRKQIELYALFSTKYKIFLRLFQIYDQLMPEKSCHSWFIHIPSTILLILASLAFIFAIINIILIFVIIP